MKKTGVVAFAFGASANIWSNRIIAKIASEKAQERRVSVYTQRDIEIDTRVYGVPVFYTTEKFGKPPPTLRIARGAVSWAAEQGINNLWVVAAEPHLTRCVRDMEFAVNEVNSRIEIYTCSEILCYPEDKWFCPDSTQSCTRSREAWEERERILRFMPFFLYKYIAS